LAKPNKRLASSVTDDAAGTADNAVRDGIDDDDDNAVRDTHVVDDDDVNAVDADTRRRRRSEMATGVYAMRAGDWNATTHDMPVRCDASAW
jgi:hypothetical protein